MGEQLIPALAKAQTQNPRPPPEDLAHVAPLPHFARHFSGQSCFLLASKMASLCANIQLALISVFVNFFIFHFLPVLIQRLQRDI